MANARTLIRPSSRWARPKLREVWECRELVAFLVWRNVAVTALGTPWGPTRPRQLSVQHLYGENRAGEQIAEILAGYRFTIQRELAY